MVFKRRKNGFLVLSWWTSLLCIVGELARGGSVDVAVWVGFMFHVPCFWFLELFFCPCYYPHMLRDKCLRWIFILCFQCVLCQKSVGDVEGEVVCQEEVWSVCVVKGVSCCGNIYSGHVYRPVCTVCQVLSCESCCVPICREQLYKPISIMDICKSQYLWWTFVHTNIYGGHLYILISMVDICTG